MSHTTRGVLLLFIAAFAFLAATLAAGQSRIPPAPRTIVVAELFTSEGCSSCPPADDLLRRLVATQPIEGVEIVALGNHVDYWDHQGWRDPFSSPALTQRQSAYEAAVFRTDRIYTPQLVVDGGLECVASDAGEVRRTVLKAAKQPKASVSVAATTEDAAIRLAIGVQIPASVKRRGDADIMIAVTEDGLANHVLRGENRGRTMAHSAVVRVLAAVGRIAADENTASISTVVALGGDWKRESLRYVAFVQERTGRRIIGAAAR